MIPKPESDYGLLYENEDKLTVNVKKVELKEYESYLDECKGSGFTVEAEERGNGYTAFNKDGYKIDIRYNSKAETMDIWLEAPIKRNQIAWPVSGLASLLPAPKSLVGDVRIDSEREYMVYICDMDVSMFDKYVEACKGKGFNVNFNAGDGSYSASNKDGVSLYLDYMGNSTMSISLHAPSEEEPEEVTETPQETKEPIATKEPKPTKEPTKEPVKTKEPTKEPVKTEKPKEEDKLVDGMRPEFKKAMDEYEDFFDEYCEFMEKVANNPEDLSLMLEYGEFMTQYTETMEAMEELGDEDLNDREMEYYIEVTGRINKKLLQSAY